MKHRLVAFCVMLFAVVAFTHAQSQLLRPALDSSLARIDHPSIIQDFTPIYHLQSRNQDTTNICWSFATSSFIETEMQRLGRTPVALAPMYFAYCTFIEKTKEFVRTKGASRFSEGDLFSGVIENVKAYGIVPLSAYRGQTRNCPTLNNEPLMKELETAIGSIRSDSLWNESAALAIVIPILNRYLGEPPASFDYEGSTYSPAEFRDKIVRLPWDDYVLVTSFMYAPYHKKTELRVPDNWKHYANYLNVPLNEFYALFTGALSRQYSVAFDADISEPSYRLTKQYAFIPDFDLPTQAITPEAREFRFQAGATTDDHLMHAIGYTKKGKEDWFLVKDSWRTAHEGPLHGYIIMHSSYVKMKVLAFLVHKDGVPELMK